MPIPTLEEIRSDLDAKLANPWIQKKKDRGPGGKRIAVTVERTDEEREAHLDKTAQAHLEELQEAEAEKVKAVEEADKIRDLVKKLKISDEDMDALAEWARSGRLLTE